MRVLFTSPILEHPAAGGPQLRIENSIKALNKVSELYVVSRISKSTLGGQEIEDYFRQYCKKFLYLPSVMHRRQQVTRRLLGKTTKDIEYIKKLVQKLEIDVIWFGYGNISYPFIKQIKEAMPNLKVVCDTDSVWSRFILRSLPFEDDPERRAKIEKEGREKELEEKAWVDLCEVTTAVSEVDAEYYREHAKDQKRVHVFSNVIDIKTYEFKLAAPHNFKNPCIYLAGSFFRSKCPMDKAARWVIGDVLPLINQQIPDIHLYIVGKGSKEMLSDIKDKNITITGKLDSVLPYLCNADVALVPLFFESGTRFKILEAAACGIPIVSTTHGAEGIPVESGRDLIIADEPDEFADGIVRIIKDREYGLNLAKECKRLVEKYYSVESLADEAFKILDYLKKRG